jgi:hypothetical protein
MIKRENIKNTINLHFREIGCMIFFLLLSSCQVQFKMNGASIDYTQIRTITIANFPNRSTLVYGPLEQRFNESLKDLYSRQTRLQQISHNGDLQIEGEITDYIITETSIGSDGYGIQPKLTIKVKVNYTNTKDPSQSFETTLSAYRTATQDFNAAQEELVEEIIIELTETIFNKTVANW